jgi:hypothetical protein
MSVRMKTPYNQGGENHVKGRRAGVEGTYGAPRGEDSKGPVGKRVAEKTIEPGERDSDGGGEGPLGLAAHSIYEKAVKNRGDSIGDKALTER